MGNPGTKEVISVKHINRTDVLLGRGHAAYSRIGNIAYRHIIWSLRKKYEVAGRMGKRDIGQHVVEEIHRLGGRFLAQNPDTKQYYKVSDEHAVMKACQALREKKMEMPAGFDQKGMKAKTKWLAKIERIKERERNNRISNAGNSVAAYSADMFTPRITSTVTISSPKNFKVSKILSETLIKSLSGIFKNDTNCVTMPCVPSDDSAEKLMRVMRSEIPTSTMQVALSMHQFSHGKNITSDGTTAQEFTSQSADSKKRIQETGPITDTEILRFLLPDPYSPHKEERQGHIDDTNLGLPAHIKSFFRGLCERCILDHDSTGEEEWIEAVTQTTLDFKDTDELGNDELSVLTPASCVDGTRVAM